MSRSSLIIATTSVSVSRIVVSEPGCAVEGSGKRACPAVKNSIIALYTSGLIADHGVSASFETVTKSGP